MAVQALLGRFVVIGADQHDPVHPRLLRLLRQLDGGFGVVAARSGDHFDPAVHLPAHPAEKLQLFLLLEGRRLPGGTGHHEGIRSRLNQMFNKF